jgi:hypothetical protein
MDKPRLPGFTAEAAVAATRRQHYRSAVGAALEGDVRRVHPSLAWWPWQGCIPNCVCVGPDACPCCIGWPPHPPWSYSFGGASPTQTRHVPLSRFGA